MNDKIALTIKKLTPSERRLIKLMILRIKLGDTQGLNIRLLSGHSNLLRVRNGRFRILYYKSSQSFLILRVDRRGYKPSIKPSNSKALAS